LFSDCIISKDSEFFGLVIKKCWFPYGTK
jgi:hypothetical protein